MEALAQVQQHHLAPLAREPVLDPQDPAAAGRGPVGDAQALGVEAFDLGVEAVAGAQPPSAHVPNTRPKRVSVCESAPSRSKASSISSGSRCRPSSGSERHASLNPRPSSQVRMAFRCTST